ncbi:MAG: hypothetical protein AAF125_24855, partial [Chloroflexota bacterium]
PIETKYIFLVILVLFVSLSLRNLRARQPLRFTLFLLIFVAMMIMPWSLGIIRTQTVAYRYSALIGVIAVYAAVCALVVEHYAATRLSKLVVGGISVLLLIFVFQHNSIGLSVYSLNQRDYAIALRLMTQIEAHPNYQQLDSAPVVPVYYTGLLDIQRNRVFRHVSTQPPMNGASNLCGVFECLPTRIPVMLLRLQSNDINFRILGRPVGDLPAAKQNELFPFIAAAQPWPHPSSVIITEQNEIVLVLSK